MGHHQTKEHRWGRSSYHQIGLVRGQFGNVPEDKWLDWIAATGFDGWEEASWELALDRCGDDAGAKKYAEERVAAAKKRGLEIFSIAGHLQGQALGDEPSAKTLQFIGGEAVEAYSRWRKAGNNPPRTDPFFVPPRGGRDRPSAGRRIAGELRALAHHIGKLQDRVIPVSGFVGSPAHCWSHWFLFPPLPSSLGGHPIPDVYKVSLELLVERSRRSFKPACNTAPPMIWNAIPANERWAISPAPANIFARSTGPVSPRRPASTSIARTWNGRVCRACNSSANMAIASTAPILRECK